jgi:hypothetical protein
MVECREVQLGGCGLAAGKAGSFNGGGAPGSRCGCLGSVAQDRKDVYHSSRSGCQCREVNYMDWTCCCSIPYLVLEGEVATAHHRVPRTLVRELPVYPDAALLHVHCFCLPLQSLTQLYTTHTRLPTPI